MMEMTTKGRTMFLSDVLTSNKLDCGAFGPQLVRAAAEAVKHGSDEHSAHGSNFGSKTICDLRVIGW
jgi:hypothetical protein